MRLTACSTLAFGLLVFVCNVKADDLEAKQANQDIMVCQYKAAVELDDGISDITALAPVIAEWCQKESDRFFQITRSRIDGRIDEKVARRAIREKDLQMASRIILMKRADERKASRN